MEILFRFPPLGTCVCWGEGIKKIAREIFRGAWRMSHRASLQNVNSNIRVIVVGDFLHHWTGWLVVLLFNSICRTMIVLSALIKQARRSLHRELQLTLYTNHDWNISSWWAKPSQKQIWGRNKLLCCLEDYWSWKNLICGDRNKSYSYLPECTNPHNIFHLDLHPIKKNFRRWQQWWQLNYDNFDTLQ